MSTRIFLWPAALLVALLLGGCGAGSDPQAALEAAAERLQDALEAKQAGAVMEQLHGDFRAGGQLDRDWARRTMTLLFLRHKNVRVIVLGKNSWIDAASSTRGHTETQVALSGAEGLIPDSAGHYSVKLEWWREGDEWKLARLDWQ